MPTGVYIKTEEHKRKLSEALKGEKNPNYGKIFSKETRKKMSEAQKGKKHSEETKKHWSKVRKGRKMSEEAKRKMSEAHKGEKHYFYGKKFTEEHRRKISEGNKGKKHTKEAKKKISEAMKGDKHPNWQGGKSFEPYSSDWTDDLRESIRKRDNYICQICGIHQDELNGRFQKLDIHHIDYDKNNLNPNNLISLCKNCHSKTNFNKNYWINYFNSFLKHQNGKKP